MPTPGPQCPSARAGGHGGTHPAPGVRAGVRPRPVLGSLCLSCPSPGQSHHQCPAHEDFGRAAKSSGATAQGCQVPAATAALHRDAEMRIWVFWSAPGRVAMQQLPRPRAGACSHCWGSARGRGCSQGTAQTPEMLTGHCPRSLRCPALPALPAAAALCLLSTSLHSRHGDEQGGSSRYF